MQNSETAGFELMSDEELVRCYNGGVQDAFGELSVRYIFVIRSEAGNIKLGNDRKDIPFDIILRFIRADDMPDDLCGIVGPCDEDSLAACIQGLICRIFG